MDVEQRSSATDSELVLGSPAPGAQAASVAAPRAALTWVIAAAMALGAGLMVAPGWLAAPEAAVPGLSWWALLPLFAFAEVVVIHLPTQRNAHGHTLREIPAVLGLTFLAPQQYVSAYVVGTVLALVFAARMRGVKLAFNAAMFALEAAVGVSTYASILGDASPLSLRGWAAVMVAVLVTDLISAAAVTAAITLTENTFDPAILREALSSGSVAALINVCVALLVATLVLVQPSALPLLGVVVVLIALGYRVYISLARSHTQTQQLYRLVDRTSSARDVGDVAQVVLREATQLLHASRAFLVDIDDDGSVRYYTSEDEVLRTVSATRDGTRAWWWAALEDGVVYYERSGRRHEEVRTADVPQLYAAARAGLAAPLRVEGAVKSVLVVCDPTFESETFSSDDRQVFEALAAHTGVALERARGVSDLRAVAAELEVARDAALAASEAKSLFLANMSHEIRTPLTTVLATAEILEDTPLDDVQTMLLEKLRRQGQLLKLLVEGVLDFSRIEAGQLALVSRPFDLHALVADAADGYESRASSSGSSFTWYLDPGVPRTVLGDPGRLFQLLGNLLDNALKFTPEGHVRLEVRRAQMGDGTEVVAFAVEDSGIGIAPEHHASIFEVFNQVDGTATRHYEGTGLGLAICKQLAGLMGGDVTVRSELGEGSTFTVLLPLDDSGAAA